jgi:hypothetical protein
MVCGMVYSKEESFVGTDWDLVNFRQFRFVLQLLVSDHGGLIDERFELQLWLGWNDVLVKTPPLKWPVASHDLLHVLDVDDEVLISALEQ